MAKKKTTKSKKSLSSVKNTGANKKVADTSIPPEPPKDIQEIHKSLAELAEFRMLLVRGTWTGKDAEMFTKCSGFLNSLYQQMLEQFQSHPYYVEHIAKTESNEEAS